MSGVALALVLVAAVAHAGWNYLAKTVGGGVIFAWFFALVDLALILPFAVLAVGTGGFPGELGFALALMAGGGVLHAVYFLLLQRAYRVADLSLVYPVARGTGPLLATAVAISLLGERPSAVALLGGGLIVLAVLSLARRAGEGSSASGDRGRRYAIATGTLIAAYTLWDKHAVDSAAISPLVYYVGVSAGRAAVLTPLAARRSRKRAFWQLHRREIIAVSALSTLAYVLILYAFTIAPVSYVAPAREVSVLIGAALGVQLLGEKDGRRRLACAGAVVVGLVALSLD